MMKSASSAAGSLQKTYEAGKNWEDTYD